MRKAYISILAYPETKKWLRSREYELEEFPEGEHPYPAVSSHPDMYMTNGGGKLIMAGKDEKRRYLGYNCVFLDKYLIHNLKLTAPKVMEAADSLGLEKIHVNQGYTKCSCAVVDGRSVITADEGICSVLRRYPDIDVLKIRAGHVVLPGFEYGFLGGASGRAGDTVLFNGDLGLHPDGGEIRRFIADRGFEVADFKGRELMDIGTIFAFSEE
jgi:hypothetical protein